MIAKKWTDRMIAKNCIPAFVWRGVMSALLASGAFVSTGCFTTGEMRAECKDNIPPDADPYHECTDPPDGGIDANSLSPESLDCKENGGDCVTAGSGDFTDEPLLLWIGED